jgi:Ni/Co efflux regulator RcnB
MNGFKKLVALWTVSAVLSAGVMFAQERHDDQNDRSQQRDGNDHQNDHYVEHKEWKKGQRINDDDWKRAQPVDYRSHHLKSPPRGYEWRQVDGNYVLAAAATGIIASAMIASGR